MEMECFIQEYHAENLEKTNQSLYNQLESAGLQVKL